MRHVPSAAVEWPTPATLTREVPLAVAQSTAVTGAERSSTPLHLWIVGALALLWNAVGAFDYLATQVEFEPYMSQFSAEQLAYFYGFPAWAVSCWAVAVWGAFFGSVALLLRKRWAVWLFGASLVGMAGSWVHSFGLSDGARIMGTSGVVFSAVVAVVAVGLFVYARGLERKGVLR
jgi:hypothetical protein